MSDKRGLMTYGKASIAFPFIFIVIILIIQVIAGIRMGGLGENPFFYLFFFSTTIAASLFNVLGVIIGIVSRIVDEDKENAYLGIVLNLVLLFFLSFGSWTYFLFVLWLTDLVNKVIGLIS